MRFFILLTFFMLQSPFISLGQNSIFPVKENPQELTPLMERELKGCFDFFWEEWNNDPKSPTYGMSNGDYVGLYKYSPIPIEHQGFYFTAIIIGVERGWISRKEAEKRASENGQIIMKQPDGSVKKVSTTEIVSIVQQQQVQYKNLQSQMGHLRNAIIEKDQELKYLTNKLTEMISNNIDLQKINTDLIKQMNEKKMESTA